MYRTWVWSDFFSACFFIRVTLTSQTIFLSGCSLLLQDESQYAWRTSSHTLELRQSLEEPQEEQGLSSDNNWHATGRSMLPPPPLEITPEVQAELDRLSSEDPRLIEVSIRNREPYYRVLREIFQDEGVPLELINVALIESRFNPTAKSSSGAVGMWQFMKSTARVYNLKVSLLQDDRKDPILSSIAAARHLKDLYLAYRDWYLALAAYNAGSARIDRAIKNGKSDDYWKLVRDGLVNDQTAKFVPRFIAVTLAMKNMSFGEIPLAGEGDG